MGVARPSVSPSDGGVGAELFCTRGAPKLNPDALKDELSSVAGGFGGIPNPNPTGFPILPPAFPKLPNGLCTLVELDPNALPKRFGGDGLSVEVNRPGELEKLELVFVSFPLPFSVKLGDPNTGDDWSLLEAGLGPKREFVDELALDAPNRVLTVLLPVSASGDEDLVSVVEGVFWVGVVKLNADLTVGAGGGDGRDTDAFPVNAEGKEKAGLGVDVELPTFGTKLGAEGDKELGVAEVEMALNPEKPVGGTGIALGIVGVVVVFVAGLSATARPFSSKSFWTLIRRALYRSSSSETSKNGFCSTAFDIVDRNETLRPRREQ